MAERPKIVHVFLASIYDDFNIERQVLLKEVFPELAAWCDSKGVMLEEHEIKWGCKQSKTHQISSEKILETIQELYFKKEMPIFLNLTSGSSALVPMWGDTDLRRIKRICRHFHLSSMDMEILYCAHRPDNPNVIFLSRNEDSLLSIPESSKPFYSHKYKHASHDYLQLSKKYQSNQIMTYGCEFDQRDPQLGDLFTLKKDFMNSVLDTVRAKLESILSVNEESDGEDGDELTVMASLQETFMTKCSSASCGLTDSLQQIEDYILSDHDEAPLVILGEAGAGKTSLLAKSVQIIQSKLTNGTLGVESPRQGQLFYHFIGAVPESTAIGDVISRLLRQFKITQETELPKSLLSACQKCHQYLSNSSSPFTIVYIDGVSQFTSCGDASILSWLPRQLGHSVRCIMSMLPNSKEDDLMSHRRIKSRQLIIPSLDINSKKAIVENLMRAHRTSLTASDLGDLLRKQASNNPLWLRSACRHLFCGGYHEDVKEEIRTLPDTMADMLELVLGDLDASDNGTLLTAALCTIVVSKSGLTKAELCQTLTRDTLQPPSPYEEKDEMEYAEKDSDSKQDSVEISDYEWRAALLTLKPFLQPYSPVLKGALSFYHQVFNKAIRRRYFRIDVDDGTEDEGTSRKQWWHLALAKYFSSDQTSISRKAEELPYHLMHLNDHETLSRCLANWDLFDALYDDEYSTELLSYWRSCGDNLLLSRYTESLKLLEEKRVNPEVLAHRYEQIARILLQVGKYSEALELNESCVKIEEQELGGRDYRLSDLFSLMSEIYDEKLKLNDFISPNQIPDLRKTIQYGRQAIKLREKLSGDVHKFKLAMSLMKLAFSLDNWDACGADISMPGSDAIKEGNEMLGKALLLFKELDDPGHYAEALMTKGVLAKRGSSHQLKYYNQAMEICQQLYGERHRLVSRLYINIGIVYEDKRNYLKAYAYFKKWARVSEDVLGCRHPKTLRAKGVLNEPRYRRIGDTLEQAQQNVMDNSLRDISLVGDTTEDRAIDDEHDFEDTVSECDSTASSGNEHVIEITADDYSLSDLVHLFEFADD